MNTESNTKVVVKGSKYTGKKWFLKIAYKTIETDVDFTDNNVIFSQGSGFASVKEKQTTPINYDEITNVSAKSKVSIPNAVFAVICAILAIATQIWALFAITALMLFSGSTAVVAVERLTNYGNIIYEIPTEFRSDADELQEKIMTAISQSK